MKPESAFDKLWALHSIADLGDGWALLHVDRHLLHELAAPQAFDMLDQRSLGIRNAELVFATADHTVSSAPDRTARTFPAGAKLWAKLAQYTRDHGLRFFDLGQPGHGIVHVMGPELGLVLPGTTVICTDSHTCTNGGLGALAFGVGSSESGHALATQTLRMRKPRSMRITVNGSLGQGVTAKDLALHIIRQLGTAAGTGHAVEYAGPAISALDIEARLTLCNLSVELGARTGLIAPDEKTIEYVRGKPFAPRGAVFEIAAAAWLDLQSDPGAVFDTDVTFDAADIAPTVTWGISPEHAIPVTGHVPGGDETQQHPDWPAALHYMGLTPGQPIEGTPIDWAFIGSCANSRLSDLRAAAGIAKGRQVAPHVHAWVVPGSENVRRAAEAEGLDVVFREAGFEWRQPGCSMCVAANGETVPKGQRSISTSNRNFIGRQGPGARTHLASPAMAAAAAIAGHITDVRKLDHV